MVGDVHDDETLALGLGECIAAPMTVVGLRCSYWPRYGSATFLRENFVYP
jgi:hypothetical protein